MATVAKQRVVAFAKTTRPVIGSAIRREALFAQLDATPGRTVAWISGPPGSGKSTLAASYIEARALRSIWYQVDPDDADVATFFHYLGHAARRLDESLSRDLPKFTPQHHEDVATFSRKFFRQLFARAKGPSVVVLDNFHEVPANGPLHAAIEAGVPQIPGRSCLLITSRNDPPAYFAKMRLSGTMTQLGWEQLRIRPEEIAEIGNLRGQSLSPEAVAKLEERTQGWVAGLVLMLEHAKISGRIADLPGDATPKVIFDYLAGEIFERFEPRMQRFLLKIACLPRMSADIAQALAGEERAGRLLINLAQNDYFVREVPGDKEQIYQFHPLLREFLKDRAEHAMPDAVSAAGLKAAAVLLQGAGQVEDAVSLLAECRDWKAIAQIAAEEADTLLEQGRGEALRGWLDLLPAQLIESDTRLLLAHAGSRIHSSPRTAMRLFSQAYEQCRREGNADGMARGASGAARAIIIEFDDLAALDRWISVLADLFKPGATGLSNGVKPAAIAALARAMLVRDPGNRQIDEWLAAAERIIADSPASPAARTELALGRAMTALFRGDIAGTAAAIGALKASSHEKNVDEAISIAIAEALGMLLDGSNEAAQRAANEGLSIAEAEGVHAYDAWLRIVLIAAALGAGNREAAAREIAALEAQGGRQRRGDQAFVHYLRGWLAQLEDDAMTATRETRSALSTAEELGIPWLECLARIRWAQALSAESDHRAAEAQLRGAEAIAEHAHCPLLRAATDLAAASVSLQGRDLATARARLKAGLALAREHGLRHLVALRASTLAELCALALRLDVETEFVRALIRSSNIAPPAAALRAKQWPRPFQVCMLGGFRLLRESAPVEFGGKGPGRPLELLKVLVALGGQNVRSEQLADALWPRVDADYAHKSFTATLHRLRRILDEDDAVILRDARLSLNPRLCWVDSWALEGVLADLDGTLRESPAGAAVPDLRPLVEEAIALYRGPFLPDESEQPSYIAFRDQTRSKLLRCLSRVTRRWEDAGMGDAAVECLQRIIDTDELGEGFYRNLMMVYQRRGETGEALSTYERLRTVLAMRLKAMPSQETQAVYAGLSAPGSAMPAPRE